ncbi:MAG: patatin-like phospholipase family protein [Paracoccaceae bacterium]
MAQPIGYDNVRFWGDYNDPAAVEELLAHRSAAIRKRLQVGKGSRIRYLALSGGGQYGAFSAGILTAWSDKGTRPQFDGVTGISTGAIIAPFAFLGADYDDVLEEIYTTLTTEDVAQRRVLAGLLRGSALSDTKPLQDRIASYVTPEFLKRIAAERAKGRLLLVGTTNLDVGRPVIWDMGAIAASGRPDALELFRKVILASAAIPIAFPPVRFTVEANGRRYEELHVDGGVTSQVSVLSPQIPLGQLDARVGRSFKRDLYVIVNGAVTPLPEAVKPTVPGIGAASVNTLWYAQATGDLYKIFATAQRDRVNTRYAWIPDTFAAEPDEQFDPVFMRKLFDLGQSLVRQNTVWNRYPPNFTP